MPCLAKMAIFMRNVKLAVTCIVCAFFINACTSSSGSIVDGIYGQWALNQVIYDGDSKGFASNSGNFVDID